MTDLKRSNVDSLKNAATSTRRVSGLTHDFYRYPARFSPDFARAAILAHTKRGDVVLDPFMGGATTVVESFALGRHVIGVDLNSLSAFLAQVKTTPLTEVDRVRLLDWLSALPPKLNLRRPPHRDTVWAKNGYQRNVSGPDTWPIRKTLEFILFEARCLDSEYQNRFVRCVALRTAQWALDSRRYIPSAAEFRAAFFKNFEEMLASAKSLPAAVSENAPRVELLTRSIVGLEREPVFATLPSPTLVLTSPPYPGVHILYHRWQVRSRRETPAPYWIANSLDGLGASGYTFGDRKRNDDSYYFASIAEAFGSVRKVCGKNTTVVQLVAFSRPAEQLPRYRDAMQQAGFAELAGDTAHLVWRSVPNRKWYATQKGTTGSSQEVVLMHRPI